MTYTPEQKREWYQANRERIRAKRKAARDASPDVDRARSRAYYAANKERAAEYGRQRYAAQKEAIQERQRAYREARGQEQVERVRAWRKANPERYAVQQGTRRRRLQVDADLTTEEWRAILNRFDGHCAYCDRTDLPLVLEHMTPLARGGRHTASNVVPSCAPCNNRKHAKTALEFAGWEIPPRLLVTT